MKYIKKGFTLVELLAVIVVLGIILVIAVPNILNLINKAKIDAFERQKELVITVTRNYVTANGNQITWTDDTAEVYLKDLQDANLIDNPLKDPRGGNFDNRKPEGTKVILTKDVSNNITYDIYVPGPVTDTTPPVITLIGNNSIDIAIGDTYTDQGATATDNVDGDITSNIVTNNNVDTLTLGTYTVTYNVKDNANNDATQVTRTVNVITTDYVISKGINKPKLITGMIPIKWNGSVWVDTTEGDAAWYDYSTGTKQWANVRTADGSMFVWIPRYAYKITSNYHITSTGTIDIKFLKDITNIASDNTTVDITPTYTGNVQNNFIVHPAFTFGTAKLSGIWVAKFEASGILSAIDIKPNASTIRSTSVDNIFTAIRNMETNNRYGWGTTGVGLDTHMMKNIEWGAVAYLTHSSYGKTGEIWLNNNSLGMTGCTGNSADPAEVASCQFTYNTANGMNASTTGNIYGIYDMSGGNWEYVAAYVDNGHASLNNGSSIVNANIKYKDVYTVTTDNQTTNYSNTILKKGDALYETSASFNTPGSWNTDYSYMPSVNTPWFIRGGASNNSTGSGSFCFFFSTGAATGNASFRVVIVPSD